MHSSFVLGVFALGLMVSMLLDAAPTWAKVVKACVADQPVAPYTFPDHEGQAQYLVRKAVERQGDTLQVFVEPRARCIENVRIGRYDGLMMGGDDLPPIAIPRIS